MRNKLRINAWLMLWIFASLWSFQIVQASQPGLDHSAYSSERPASLDPLFAGFGNDGTLSLDFGAGNDQISAIAAGPFDEKLVAVGPANPGWAVSRYLADGGLDPSFDQDGKVTITNGDLDFVTAVAVQPDRKIVVAGSAVSGGDSDFALVRLNPDGSLDASFGGDGIVTTGFGGNDVAYAVAIQADGKIVAGGDTYDCGLFSCDDDFALARYTPDGNLDASFDGDGKVTAGLGEQDAIKALVIQDDGKIVAGGDQWNKAKAAVARFLPNGAPDGSFDGDGLFSTGLVGRGTAMAVQPDHRIVLAGDKGLARLEQDGSLDIAFGKNGLASIGSIPLELIKQVLALPNGKTVIAGLYRDQAEATQGDFGDFGLARLDASGKMDPSFGAGKGFVHNDINPKNSLHIDLLNTLIQLSNGELVAAGAMQVDGASELNDALARYLPDGTLDGPGQVLTKVTDFEGINDQAAAVAVFPNRSLVAAGSADTGPFKRVGVARYTPRGLLDDQFADHGRVRSGVAQHAQAVAVDGGGNILIAASRFSSATDFDFALLKFKPDGSSLAAGFGPNGNGFVTTDLGGTDTANALAALPGGGYAVAGTSGLDFGLVKYSADGLPDTSFDQDGIVTTSFGPGSVDNAYAVLGQPDGKILVAGRSKAAGSENDNFAVARYNLDGSLDTTFDGDGLLTVDLAGESDIARDLALLPDGRILVGGTASLSGLGQMAVVRLNADGSLDSSFNGNGKALIHTGFGDNTAYAVQLLPTGNLAIAGCAANLDLGRNDMAMAILKPDGSLDASFSNDGFETYSLGGASCARDLAYDGQRLILAGYANNGVHDNYALVGVQLVVTRNIQFHLTFLPAVRK